MREPYLWNKEGPPDPDVDALVAKLAVRRHPAAPRPQKTSWSLSLASAAAVLAAVTLLPQPSPSARPRVDSGPAPEAVEPVESDATGVVLGEDLHATDGAPDATEGAPVVGADHEEPAEDPSLAAADSAPGDAPVAPATR